jgi:DNA helicase II / ATP-dependent DNA helicase PcrA
MIDFKKDLNPSQLEVVNAISGAVLVIAGAGSGKTRVIEYRVLNLLQKKVPAQAILLLTFTRRAANSMLSRAANHDPRARLVEGGTFHSFAYSILKKYAHLIGFENFSILDEDDSQEAVGLVAKKLGVYDTDKKFPKKDTLKKIISMAVNKERSIEEVLEREYPDFYDYASIVERIKNDYQRYKIEKGYFDFDDLLIYLKLLLSKREDLRLELSRKYQYIMVDEYQDTNKPQAAITYLLGKDHSNVMVVGDDAQSIYGFRGATHENIMEFPKLFPDCRIIKLEANYRSHQKILDVANAVLCDMRSKFSKNLVSAGKNSGEQPQLLLFRNGYEEAEWIVEKVLELHREGVPFGEQAVLFRSSYVSIALQVELGRQGIPFAVFGGMKFYETAHVKDLVSHFKVIANPKDELAWARIMTLLEGVGPKTAQNITSKIDPKFSFDALDKDRLCAQSKGKKYERQLRKLLDVLQAASDPGKKLSENLAGLIEYYYPILREKFDDWQQRINDLEALKEISSKYTSLRDFLADFAIDPPEKGAIARQEATPDDEKPLCLSTIHSAKGLEWECVFLIGLVEGVLPVSFSLDDEEAIDEEHRLFYVALTRAKKHLFLAVHYENHGFSYNKFNQISRFIDSPEVLSRLEQKAGVNQYEQDHTF